MKELVFDKNSRSLDPIFLAPQHCRAGNGGFWRRKSEDGAVVLVLYRIPAQLKGRVDGGRGKTRTGKPAGGMGAGPLFAAGMKQASTEHGV